MMNWQWEHFVGQMETHSRENGDTDLCMAQEFTVMLMEEDFMVVGILGGNMVLVIIKIFQIEKSIIYSNQFL